MLEDDEERRHDEEHAGGADEHSAYGADAYSDSRMAVLTRRPMSMRQPEAEAGRMKKR